jgi:hypothetical protein
LGNCSRKRRDCKKTVQYRILELPRGLVRAFDLKNGDCVKVTVEINNKEFSFFAKMKKGKKLYILVRAGTYSSLGLKPEDYVRLSRDRVAQRFVLKVKPKLRNLLG